MDWVATKDGALVVLEFVKIAAWPFVVLIAFMVFGKTIKTTLGRILSFEASGIKAELAALEVKVEHIDRDLKLRRRWWQFWRPNPASPEQTKPNDNPQSQTGATSSQEPTADQTGKEEHTATPTSQDADDAVIGQIMRNWAELEASIFNLHQRLFAGSGGSDRPYRKPRSVVTAVDDLRRNKMVASSAYAAFAEAQQVRNAIVHGRPLTPEEISAFVRLIGKLKNTVQSWQDGML